MLGIHFSAVVFTQHLVRKVGYFDENLWPAYVEDCDLMLRVCMAAVGLEFDVDSISDVDWEVPGHYRYLQPKPSILPCLFEYILLTVSHFGDETVDHELQ